MKDPQITKKEQELLAHESAYSKSDWAWHIEQLERQQKRYDEGVELAERLTNMVNHSYGDEQRGFIDAMNRSHRTLQQQAFGLMMAWISDLAERKEDGWYDLRNEAAVKAAKKIKELLGTGFERMPLI